MPRRTPTWPRLLLALGAAVVGFALFAFVGAIALPLLLEAAGRSPGWEDLAAAAASLFTFGPLGAVIGAASVLAPDLGPDQRRWLAAAAFTALAAGVVTWFAVDVLWGVAVFVWGAALAVLVWLVGSLRGGSRGSARTSPTR